MEKIISQSEIIEMKNNCVHFMFAYQKKDINLMMSFCREEGEVNFIPLGEAGKGKIGGLGRALWMDLVKSFPDLDNTIDAIVSEGENVRCQVLISGTQESDFAGIVNKGKHFESDHIFIFHVDGNGKIDKIDIEWDHDNFCKQLQ